MVECENSFTWCERLRNCRNTEAVELPEFLNFSLEKSIFYHLLNLTCFLFCVKNGSSLLCFDLVFTMQLSDITKSLNFGSNSKKKKLKKILKNIIFSRKSWFLQIRKYIVHLNYGWLIDLNHIFPIKPS